MKNGAGGNSKTKVPVTVRVPEHLLRQIDKSLDALAVPTSRNTWLLEAAVEKLVRGHRKVDPNGS
jgi:hypothetical protein